MKWPYMSLAAGSCMDTMAEIEKQHLRLNTLLFHVRMLH